MCRSRVDMEDPYEPLSHVWMWRNYHNSKVIRIYERVWSWAQQLFTSLTLARLALVSGSSGSCPVAPGGRWYSTKGKLLTSFPPWPLSLKTFSLSLIMSCCISSGRFCSVSFASNRAFSWSFLILARTRSSFPVEPGSLLSGPVRVLVSTADEWKKTPLRSLDESGKKNIAPKHRVINALNIKSRINFSVSLKEVGLADFLFGVAAKGRRVATGIFPVQQLEQRKK